MSIQNQADRTRQTLNIAREAQLTSQSQTKLLLFNRYESIQAFYTWIIKSFIEPSNIRYLEYAYTYYQLIEKDGWVLSSNGVLNNVVFYLESELKSKAWAVYSDKENLDPWLFLSNASRQLEGNWLYVLNEQRIRTKWRGLTLEQFKKWFYSNKETLALYSDLKRQNKIEHFTSFCDYMKYQGDWKPGEKINYGPYKTMYSPVSIPSMDYQVEEYILKLAYGVERAWHELNSKPYTQFIREVQNYV